MMFHEKAERNLCLFIFFRVYFDKYFYGLALIVQGKPEWVKYLGDQDERTWLLNGTSGNFFCSSVYSEEGRVMPCIQLLM